MIIYATIAGALVLAGATAGILAMLAVGIHREEKKYSLTIDSPDRIVSSVRAATGAYAKVPGVAQESRPSSDRLALAGHGPRF